MLKEEAAEIIKDAASEGRLNYHSLTLAEKRTVVAQLVYNSDQSLIDADDRKFIQNAVANVIFTNASMASILQLLDAINVAFLTGDSEYESHYADQIQTLLIDEWSDNNRQPNEHFEYDIIQRTRDILDEQCRMNGIF